MFFSEEEQDTLLEMCDTLSDFLDELAEGFNTQVVKNREKIDKLNNSYVMLTFVGFLPSAISCLSSSKDILVPFTLILFIMFLNISYIISYICIYLIFLRYFRLQIDKIDDPEERDLLMLNICAPDQEDSDMSKDEIIKTIDKYIKIAYNLVFFKKYCYAILHFKLITYITQFLVIILSVTTIIFLAISKKNDDYGLPDLAQLIITVSIFVINILLSVIYVYKF
jgi:hypothetical protein